MFSGRWFSSILVLGQLAGVCACAQQYAFHEDGEAEGLNSLTVNCLLQDRAGSVWAGTENGLYVSDGSIYNRIGAAEGLLDSYILSIYEDASGEMWVGTANNIYHGRARHFSAVAAASHGLPGAQGQQLGSIDPGHVLVESQHRLFQLMRTSPQASWSIKSFFSATSLTAHPQLNTIHSVYVDRNRQIWLGCGEAICQVSGNSIKVWGTGQGVAADTWSWFLQDSAGRLWARSYHHVRQLTLGAERFANEDISPALVTYNTCSVPMVEDPYHRILTRTDRGLAVWNQGRWQILGAANGLTMPGIVALMVDQDGGLWMGTYGKGIQRWLGYGNWETWAAGQGMPGNLVWSVLRDNRGTVWAATEAGIGKLDRGADRFVTWHPNSNVPRGQVVDVRAAPDGSLWFSSLRGELLHYFPDSGKMHHWTMPTGWRQVWLDSESRMWGLANSGLYRAEKGSNQIVKVHDPALQDQRISDACEDPRHGIWFASKTGILRFSSGTWSRIELSSQGAEDGFVSVACAADGTLWLGGASTGILHVAVQGTTATLAKPQPPPEFSGLEVMFLVRDHRGWLWVGTGSGVYIFNGNRWRHVTKKDGLTWDDCNEGAFFEDTDGSVWIGTPDGLSHLLHPEDLFKPYALRIIDVHATLGNASIPVGSSITFPWTREPLRVHMAFSAFEHRSSIVYRYRIVGLDREWLTSKNPDLQYSALPDGKFQLELFAEDTGQNVRSPLTVLSFRIRPPWWKSIPFLLTMAALLPALAFALQRFRERSLRARQAALEALVRERTEELENEKQQLLDAREALREQATHDGLTGLLNHGAIHEVVATEMARSRRDGTPLMAVMIDIDHFKKINDLHGHVAGDEVLRELARRLTGAIRPYDSAGRYGGEEFLLILPGIDGCRDPEQLSLVHNAICGAPIRIGNIEVSITCSLGASLFCGDSAMTVETFIDRADKALYKAKDGGRNRIEFEAHPLAVHKRNLG